MILRLEFELIGKRQHLPYNYQYPIMAWIYKTLNAGDTAFATFLHENGYQMESKKRFKLFTFSSLRFPKGTYRPSNRYKEYMEVYARKAWLDISFYLPEQLNPFVKGLFEQALACIGDKKHVLQMKVKNVGSDSIEVPEDDALWYTKTPVVLGYHRENMPEEYIHPLDIRYAELLHKNIADKCRVAGLSCIDGVEVCMDKVEMRTKLQKIKAYTPEETSVKGYFYSFKIKAPNEVKELLLYTGIGSENSMGFGMCGIRK